MKAGGGVGPGVQQWRCHAGERRPGGQGAPGVLRPEGKALDRKDVKMGTGRGRTLPQVEQGRDVQAGAEAEFADREPAASDPDLGKTTASQKDRATFREPVLPGIIDVVETAGPR